MTQRKLKLVKSAKDNSRPTGQTDENRNQTPALEQAHSEIRIPHSEIDNPAVADEAARFKALTAARAARQAMLRRIMAELLAVDDVSPAA